MKNIAIKNYFMTLTLLISLLTAGSVYSKEDPTGMLRQVTSSVMQELKTHRQELQKNPGKLYSLVEHLVLPHADFHEMARWVVGRNAWGATDSETQNAFINEFKTLVVRSYARSLLEYTDQEIQFLPIRGSLESQRIQVSSLIKESGRSPIRMDYRLVYNNSDWKVYDIIIEGVSLMQGYRAQFADDIRQGGVAAAVNKMRKHNNHG